MDLLGWFVYYAKYLLAFIPLGLIPVMIFLERKGAAIIQDRPGPNRAAWNLPLVGQVRAFGFIHNISDVVKLVMKEDFIPARAHKWFYLFAPCVPVLTALLTPALIPWFAPVAWEGLDGSIGGSVIEANSSLLLLFALAALSVYGVVLGSWGSNSKFSLLGGLRSSAMMISYEVAMGLGVIGLILIVGSFNMSEIVRWQEEVTWGIIVQPVGFFLFLTAMFAETGRTPFDVAEGESEIVGGFHTEYSSIKFALFFMGEYAHVVVASALLATLFLGGWDLWPDIGIVNGGGTETVRAHLGWVLGGLLIVKVLILAALVRLVSKQRKRYAEFQASDRAAKLKEYGLFRGLFGLGALAALVAAILCVALINNPEPLRDATGALITGADGYTAYAPWVVILTAVTQVGIVIGKTLFFCWLFVWVRWTLPRLRYDQIMSLGWKVLLNIALVNLLITAVIAKLIMGGK